MEEVAPKGLLDVHSDLWEIIVQDDWTTDNVLALRRVSRQLWHDKKLLRQQIAKWLKTDLRGLTEDMDVILTHCKNAKVRSLRWKADIERIYTHLNTLSTIPEDAENWDPELKRSINTMIQATPVTLLYNDDNEEQVAEVNMRRMCAVLARFLATEDNHATVALESAANRGSRERCNITCSQFGKRIGFIAGPAALFFGLLFRYMPWKTAEDLKKGHDVGVTLILLGVVLFCLSGAAELYSNRRARGILQNGSRYLLGFWESPRVEVMNDEEAQLRPLHEP